MDHSLLYPQNNAARRAVRLDGMWGFQFDPHAQGERENWAAALPEPMAMPVPASFCDLFTDKASREYCGVFWYETDFFVPGEWRGKIIELRFGSGAQRARVFVNGALCAEHAGAYLPFAADVTDAVRFGADNHVAVWLDNALTEDQLPCGTTGRLASGARVNRPYFDFFPYAGLQRSVDLTARPREAFMDFTVAHRLAHGGAFTDYTVAVSCGDGAEIDVELFDASGASVASCAGAEGTLSVPDAHLWGPGHPYLYTLQIRLSRGGELLDVYRSPVGIRTVAVEGTRILLNGEPVYLRGFGKHEDSAVRGRGFDPAVLKRDFALMRWTGANCFRTSHYPYAEETYQLADREGFLILDEVPAVGMFESLMNFAAAASGSGKKLGYFEKPATPRLLENHLAQVEEMIVRDRNHPCVIGWSLLNEPESTSPGAYAYFERVFARAHALDPQKRPRSYASIMFAAPDKDPCIGLCDFISLNRYYGWYVQGGAELEDAEQSLRAELAQWAQKGKPVVFTEFGADTLAELHSLPSVQWSCEYQEELLEMSLRVFRDCPCVQGELVWNFADFATTEQIMRVGGNRKGVFTRDRQPKPAAHLLRRWWTREAQR